MSKKDEKQTSINDEFEKDSGRVTSDFAQICSFEEGEVITGLYACAKQVMIRDSENPGQKKSSAAIFLAVDKEEGGYELKGVWAATGMLPLTLLKPGQICRVIHKGKKQHPTNPKASINQIEIIAGTSVMSEVVTELLSQRSDITSMDEFQPDEKQATYLSEHRFANL